MDLNAKIFVAGHRGMVGSKGNCTVVRADDDLLLVDVGFSCREIRARLDEVGIAPERVRGVMVTHGHSERRSYGCGGPPELQSVCRLV